MGYRVLKDRIMALNVYGDNDNVKENRLVKWNTCVLSEATLESEAFHRVYPKLSDGLVVALNGDNNKLLMASYGAPPLGAIPHRPDVA
jgi:hypothetical protein